MDWRAEKVEKCSCRNTFQYKSVRTKQPKYRCYSLIRKTIENAEQARKGRPDEGHSLVRALPFMGLSFVLAPFRLRCDLIDDSAIAVLCATLRGRAVEVALRVANHSVVRPLTIVTVEGV